MLNRFFFKRKKEKEDAEKDGSLKRDFGRSEKPGK